jgi:Cu(I)/Ag(I) efflux system membrane fusion protein
MAEMTAEEHARMVAGGTQGAVDTTGQVRRQPVRLTSAQERALGVVYATVRRQAVTRTIRTVGEIQAPESRLADVTLKVDGFVEVLLVAAMGEPVRKGQPLLTVYSPMLVSAQEELLTARRLLAQVDPSSAEAYRNAQSMLEAARRRLAAWDIEAAQIAELERSGTVPRTVTLRSPVAGVVLEKEVVQGQKVMSGMRLYRIADLSEVWVEGEVFEQELRFVHPGVEAHIEVAAYPGQHLMGRVAFVYPTIDRESRTNRVRIVLPNPGLRLKPGMFATIYVDVSLGEVLIAPANAVIVTGNRNVVFVREADGTLVPREVVVGSRLDDRVEILDGLKAGESIVASANFLVDAESQLAATPTQMPGIQHGSAVDTGKKRVAPAAKPGEHQHD